MAFVAFYDFSRLTRGWLRVHLHMSKNCCTFAALFKKNLYKIMSQEHFEHIIEQMKAQIAHDEAMSAMLRAHAAQDKQMLDLILEQKEEIERLKEQQHITHVRIGDFSGTYIENFNQTPLCQPSSTTSTERTSSTSTPMFRPKITPLNSQKQ